MLLTFKAVNRKWISILTVLSVFGLTGLTIVQLVWLKNAITVKEQRFDNSVREALFEISTRVQDFEFQPLIQDLIAKNAQKIGNQEPLKPSFQSMVHHQLPGMQRLYIHIDDYSDTIEYSTTSSALNAESNFSNIQAPTMEISIDDLPVSVMVDPEEFMQKYIEQTKAINKLVLKQLFSMQPITEVLDTGKLREMIAETLERKGVETKFEFGITEYTLNNFVFASTGATLKELYNSSYVVNLFPQSMIESTKQLMLVFPKRRQYLLNSLWIPLGFSSLFMLLVITSFGLALYVILKQKQVSEMKTEFINNMTHELKTPISTISLASQMLRDEGIASVSANRMKYATVIFDENKRLGNQVERVLQMAKMEKGEITYNLAQVNFHDLVEVATSQFKIQIDDLDGKLIQNLNAKDTLLDADELHLTNVINNLLDNALKYNDKEHPEIEVSTINTSNSIRLKVRDNGMGMKKEELNKIFDKFYRVNKGDVHNTKGFGLGLSYVKTIVNVHNGTIDVKSEFGKGTTFILELPLKKV